MTHLRLVEQALTLHGALVCKWFHAPEPRRSRLHVLALRAAARLERRMRSAEAMA